MHRGKGAKFHRCRSAASSDASWSEAAVVARAGGRPTASRTDLQRSQALGDEQFQHVQPLIKPGHVKAAGLEPAGGLVAADDRFVAGARGSRVTPQPYIEA